MIEKVLFNKPLKLNSYAKINLYLDVIRKLPNSNYHEIVTLFSSINLFDELYFYISDINHLPDYVLKIFKFQIQNLEVGTIYLGAENIKIILLKDEDCEKCFSVPTDDLNTVVIATKKFFAHIPFKKFDKQIYVYILFNKKIPTGAGLGGGSSNAATTLKALNYLFGVDFDDDTLIEICKLIGADVPFTLKGGSILATNIGDKFYLSYDLPSWPIIIVYPNFEVSSKDAYANVKNYIKYDINTLDGLQYQQVLNDSLKRAQNLGELLKNYENYGKLSNYLFNKLEEPVFTRKRQIKELKETLIHMGYKNVLMTGSGSAIYVILNPTESIETHQMHYEKIKNEMHRRYSKTYKIFLTYTQRNILWEKMLS